MTKSNKVVSIEPTIDPSVYEVMLNGNVIKRFSNLVLAELYVKENYTVKGAHSLCAKVFKDYAQNLKDIKRTYDVDCKRAERWKKQGIKNYERKLRELKKLGITK